MRTLISLIILAIIATACGSKETRSDDDRPVVAVSSGPEEMLLRRIADDRVRCVKLLPPGADAEHFEPSVSTMRSLRDASLWFTLGTPGFEANLATRLPANFPDMETVNLADGIEPLEGTHEEGDPHLTASLRNLQTIAYTITNHLIRLLPDDEEQLRENNATLQLHLRTLDDSISALLSERGTPAFVVLHPNLSYFARDYGLRQIALERDGKEPTPSAMAAALREARAAGAKVMVLDAAHPNEGAAALARGEGLRVLALSLTDTTIVQSLRQLSQALSE